MLLTVQTRSFPIATKMTAIGYGVAFDARLMLTVALAAVIVLSSAHSLFI